MRRLVATGTSAPAAERLEARGDEVEAGRAARQRGADD
jgi:hypothetical protein